MLDKVHFKAKEITKDRRTPYNNKRVNLQRTAIHSCKICDTKTDRLKDKFTMIAEDFNT